MIIKLKDFFRRNFVFLLSCPSPFPFCCLFRNRNDKNHLFCFSRLSWKKMFFIFTVVNERSKNYLIESIKLEMINDLNDSITMSTMKNFLWSKFVSKEKHLSCHLFCFPRRQFSFPCLKQNFETFIFFHSKARVVSERAWDFTGCLKVFFGGKMFRLFVKPFIYVYLRAWLIIT